MAGRRAWMQLLRVSQVQKAVVQSAAVPRQAALASFSHGEVGRQGFERTLYGGSSFSSRQLHSENQAKVDNHETHEYESAKMTSEGGGSVGPSFSEKAAEIKNSRTVTKASGTVDEAKDKASDTVDEVKDKTSDTVDEVKDKTSDTVGDVKDKASETVDKAKESASEAQDKAGSVTSTVTEKASKEADAAKDMFKDFPQKVSETATGLKEVGVEAAKAVKRDAGKVAEKVGLKSE